jgi:hypothetical protein
VRFCIIAVALAGVIAFAQKADAARVPQWGAHMNELSSALMNDFVANRDGQHKGVHLGVPGPAGHGTEPGVSGASGSSRPETNPRHGPADICRLGFAVPAEHVLVHFAARCRLARQFLQLHLGHPVLGIAAVQQGQAHFDHLLAGFDCHELIPDWRLGTIDLERHAPADGGRRKFAPARYAAGRDPPSEAQEVNRGRNGRKVGKSIPARGTGGTAPAQLRLLDGFGRLVRSQVHLQQFGAGRLNHVQLRPRAV